MRDFTFRIIKVWTISRSLFLSHTLSLAHSHSLPSFYRDLYGVWSHCIWYRGFQPREFSCWRAAFINLFLSFLGIQLNRMQLTLLVSVRYHFSRREVSLSMVPSTSLIFCNSSLAISDGMGLASKIFIIIRRKITDFDSYSIWTFAMQDVSSGITYAQVDFEWFHNFIMFVFVHSLACGIS